MKEYGEVFVDLRVDALDRPLHYTIPPHLRETALPGVRVEVPLGRRKTTGIITDLIDRPEVEQTREVISVLDSEPLLNKEMLSLADFLTDHYHCRRIEALRLLLPPGMEKVQPALEVMLSPAPGVDCSRQAAELAAKAPRQAQVMAALSEKGSIGSKELRALGITRQTLNRLQEKGLVVFTERRLWREENLPGDKEFAAPLTLTESQQLALAGVEKALALGEETLLFGVTGSGKTEIYLQAIASCLSRGQQALVLVPEIALTPQMVMRFRGRFGSLIAVMHSGLTTAQRLDAWWRVRLGDAPIVLGARSAVFAPVQNLGLLVMDEEHEGSYKQEEPSPRYHARDVARWRCRYHRAGLLLGSATPSLESFRQAKESNALLVLPGRVSGNPLPPVEVVDMRRELKRGNKSIFSHSLRKGLEAALLSGQQSILLINRRGTASFLLCRQCGQVIRCPHCSVSLTLHGSRQSLVCHYCSYSRPVLDTCPHCSSRYLRPFGVGTQRVEEEVKKLFPANSVFRLDADTASRRGAYRKILESFAATAGGVLVGTQMVAKGLDIAGIALVGVVNADTALHLPDFRASERTFQLLTQVAGRTGRGKDPGTVVVQTYNPSHFAVTTAAAQDYQSFYEQEIVLRQQLYYPPFCRLMRLLVTFTDEEVTRAEAARLKEILRPLAEAGGLEILGPAVAPLAMLRGRYRQQILLRGAAFPPASDWQPLWQSFRESAPKDLRLIVDPDPYSLL